MKQSIHQWLKTSGLAIAGLLVGAAAGTAADWGTLKGKFILEGAAPAPTPLKGTEKDGCNKFKLLDEGIIVGANNELGNVFVYLRSKSPSVAPSYTEQKGTDVILDNKDCRFEPHCIIVTTAQKLVVTNSDPFAHNSNITPFKPANKPENPLIPAGGKFEKEFKAGEALPINVSCNIHPWMSAKLLIRDDPYAAVSAADGTFEIVDLPAGKELEFQFWQESGGNVAGASFDGGKSDTKGRFKLKIKPGENDLGEIKVPLKSVKK
jgi:hypothetical protein